MKNLFVLLISVLFSSVVLSQPVFRTQNEVDSFAQIQDTSILIQVNFVYDTTIPQQDRISDLSGFDSLLNFGVSMEGFIWKDMPYFKNLSEGWLIFKNMPELKSISGVRNFEGQFTIDNCPKLSSFPPPGVLKYANTLTIVNQTVPEMHLTLNNVQYNPRGAAWSNKVDLFDNNISRLIIEDPNGTAVKLRVVRDNSLRYLEVNGDTNQVIDIVNNPLLDTIRGFSNANRIVPHIMNNPKLKDLCVMRPAIDNYYQTLRQRDKDYWNTGNFGGNGVGASTYEQMMAYDCTWVGDTFTSVPDLSPKQEGQITLYPNPVSKSNGVVSVTTSKNWSSVRIINTLGNSVLETEINTKSYLELNISELKQGLYILELSTSEEKQQQRFVIIE